MPGLAIDSRRGHAFVVSPGLVADVDLATLETSYHALGRTLSSRAKTAAGFVRTAQILGTGVLAVSGVDQEGSRSEPAGLRLVDPGGWTTRAIDATATRFVVARDVLLATGSHSGVSAYSLDGAKRFALLPGEDAWVTLVYRGLAYVDTGRRPLQIVDLASGRIVGERMGALPWLLLGRSSGWWGPT